MPKYNGRRVSKYLAELMKLYNGRCVFCDSEVMTVRIAQELGLKYNWRIIHQKDGSLLELLVLNM